MSNQHLNRLLNTPRIITMSFVMAQLVFVGMCYVATEGNTEPLSWNMPLLLGLSAMALGAAGASVASRFKFLGGLAVGFLVPQELRPADPVSDRALAEELEALGGRFQTGQIISLVTAEATSLFGLAVAYLHQAWPLMLPYVLVGVSLCALYFPTRRGLLSVLSPGARAALQA